MMLIDLARINTILVANAGSHAYDLSHHAYRTHEAGGPQSDMRDTDTTSCHEEVVYIARIEATIGYSIWWNGVGLRSSLELGTGKLARVYRIREVEIEVPVDGKRGILVVNLLIDIVFLEDIVTQ